MGSIVDSNKRYRALAQMYGRDVEVYYLQDGGKPAMNIFTTNGPTHKLPIRLLFNVVITVFY